MKKIVLVLACVLFPLIVSSQDVVPLDSLNSSNGSKEIITNSSFKIQKNNIKITFLSWFTGSSKVTYERYILPHQSMEFSVGWIGAGYDKHKNVPRGYTFRYAYKFMFFQNPKYVLDGFYVKPEFILSDFRYNPKDGTPRTRSLMGTAMGLIGYQFARNWFVADVFFGVGYAWGTPADTWYQHGFMLWDFFNTKNENISTTFGIKVGVLF